MTTVTGQRFPNGSVNGKYPGAAHHHHIMHGLVGGDDDTGGATEQFPPFDPLHDGSEEESQVHGNSYSDDDDEYTHSSTTTGSQGTHGNGNGSGYTSSVQGEAEGTEERGKEQPRSDTSHYEHNGLEVGEEGEQEEQSHTPMSNVDPVPESDLHHHQQQQDASKSRDNDASTTTQTTTTQTTILSPVTSPPYWALAHTDSLNAGSSASRPFNHDNPSMESLVPGAITLQDNEAEEDDGGHGDLNGHSSNCNGEPARQRTSEETRTSYGRDRNKACWAKSVEVTNYVIVNGSATNIGAFVVWNIRVQTLSGPYMNIRKRYSEFDDFRHRLIQTFPTFEAAVPVLPPKSVIAKFRPRFLEKRRAGLQYFLNCILLNPEFSGSPVLKDFLFS